MTNDREEWLRQNGVYEVFELRQQLQEAQQERDAAKQLLSAAGDDPDYVQTQLDLQSEVSRLEAQCATQAAQLQRVEALLLAWQKFKNYSSDELAECANEFEVELRAALAAPPKEPTP